MKHKIKCACCDDTLEIHVGDGQVIFTMEVKKWSFWSRVKYAFGIIFRWKTGRYGSGGTMWIGTNRWKKFLAELNHFT